jgi:hypothetical protein
MPIKPENKHRYPTDWPQIRARILQRARYSCEWCGVRNGAWGWRDNVGKFHPVRKGPILDLYPRDERPRPPFTMQSTDGPLKIIEIVLTIAHLDHTPENCAADNLKAGCQRCHLQYDQPHHKVTAYMTRRARRHTLELPL